MDIVIKNFWTYPDDTTTDKDIIFLFAKPDGGGGFTIRQQTKEDLFKIASSMQLQFIPAGPTTMIVFDSGPNARLTYEDIVGVLGFAGMSAIDIDANTILQFNQNGGELINFDQVSDVKLNYIGGARVLWIEKAGSLIMSSNFSDSDIQLINGVSDCRISLGGPNADTGQKRGTIQMKDTADNEMLVGSDVTETSEDVEVNFAEPRNDYDISTDDPLKVAYREDHQFSYVEDPANAAVISAPDARFSVAVVRIVTSISNLTLDFPANPKDGDTVSFSVFGDATTNIVMTSPGATIDNPLSGSAARHIRTWVYNDVNTAWLRIYS
jgi:hypothetical protein